MALDTRGLASGFGQGFGLADQYYARQHRQGLQDQQSERADESFDMQKQQFAGQQEDAQRNRNQEQAKFVLSKAAQGVMPNNEELTFLKEHTEYWPAFDPETDTAIENAQRVIDPNDPMGANDPEALYSMNLLFGHRVNRGEGGKKRIAGMYPGSEPEKVTFDLGVTGEDGKEVLRPMTKNRGVEGDDEILQTNVGTLVDQVQGYRMMRNAFQTPEGQQTAAKINAALRGDQPGKAKTAVVKGKLVNTDTGEVIGDYNDAQSQDNADWRKMNDGSLFNQRTGEVKKSGEQSQGAGKADWRKLNDGTLYNQRTGESIKAGDPASIGGGGKDPANVKTAKWMMANMADVNTAEEAWDKLKTATTDPARYVSDYIDQRIEYQKDNGPYPGEDGYRTPDQMQDDALISLQTVRNYNGKKTPNPGSKGLKVPGDTAEALPVSGRSIKQENGSYSGRINRDPQQTATTQAPANTGQATAPTAAIDMLRKNPDLAAQFRQKYGYLPEGF